MKISSFLSRIGLNQVNFAEKMGYSKTLINAWVSERVFPSYEKVLELINAGITAQELFGDEAAEKLLQSSSKGASNSHDESSKEQIINEVFERLISYIETGKNFSGSNTTTEKRSLGGLAGIGAGASHRTVKGSLPQAVAGETLPIMSLTNSLSAHSKTPTA